MPALKCHLTLFAVVAVRVVGDWTPTAVAMFARDMKSFGESVAVCDDTVVVGAPESHKALIFSRDEGGNWAGQASAVLNDGTKDSKDGGASQSDFGWDVAIAGGLVAVGTPRKRRVHLFQRSSGQSWTLEAMLERSDTESFGSSVALTGDGGVLVGAPDSNSAFIYDRSSGWKEPIATFKSDGGFGHAVGASRGRVIVGAPNARRSYIYERNADGQGWSVEPVQTLEVNQLGFGYTAKIAGNYAIVGAPYAQRAFVYERSPKGEWSSEPAVELDYPEEAGFGHVVGISDRGRALVTSHTSRKAHLFERVGEVWVADQIIDAYSNTDGAFGMAAGLADRRVVVSAYPTRTIYVFEHQLEKDAVARQVEGEDMGPASSLPFIILLGLGAVLVFLRKNEIWKCYLRRLAKQRKKGDSSGGLELKKKEASMGDQQRAHGNNAYSF